MDWNDMCGGGPQGEYCEDAEPNLAEQDVAPVYNLDQEIKDKWLDEYGYHILPSIRHLYTWSDRMLCWIGNHPWIVKAFHDMPGQPISAHYWNTAGYFLNGYVFSSKEAADRMMPDILASEAFAKQQFKLKEHTS